MNPTPLSLIPSSAAAAAALRLIWKLPYFTNQSYSIYFHLISMKRSCLGDCFSAWLYTSVSFAQLCRGYNCGWEGGGRQRGVGGCRAARCCRRAWLCNSCPREQPLGRSGVMELPGKAKLSGASILLPVRPRFPPGEPVGITQRTTAQPVPGGIPRGALGSAPQEPATGREAMASSCIRGGSGWIFGKMSFLQEWSVIGPGCPGQWWSPHPWRCLRNV